ncbi:MAG: hypothetical protein AB7N99_06435 [Simkaniaceae bacterium]
MNLSVENMPSLGWSTPLQLLDEITVHNQTGYPLDLIVAIYSLDNTEIGNDQFSPNEAGHFMIRKPSLLNPDSIQVFLFGYQRANHQNPTYEKQVSFTALFQNLNYCLS